MTKPLLPTFGAIVGDGRVVRDRNRITGGGVTAGLDFGLGLVGELRDRTYAEAVQLLAEYAPDPPYQAGDYRTAPREPKAILEAMFVAFVLRRKRTPRPPSTRLEGSEAVAVGGAQHELEHARNDASAVYLRAPALSGSNHLPRSGHYFFPAGAVAASILLHGAVAAGALLWTPSPSLVAPTEIPIEVTIVQEEPQAPRLDEQLSAELEMAANEAAPSSPSALPELEAPMELPR